MAEAIGLALGVFPIVTQIVRTYQGRLTDNEIDELLKTLANKERIFHNAVEELISPLFSNQHLCQLLDHADEKLWCAVGVEARLQERLGDKSTELFETAASVKRTIDELKRKLPVSFVSCTHSVSHECTRRPRFSSAMQTNALADTRIFSAL